MPRIGWRDGVVGVVGVGRRASGVGGRSGSGLWWEKAGGEFSSRRSGWGAFKRGRVEEVAFG